MNRPLRRVALACVVLFGLLLVNVNWVQVVKAEDYRDDPRNSRVLLRAYERERGPIAVLRQDGLREAVAESVRTDGPLTWLRQYPGGPSYAHVTGYYSLVYGRTGIERAEDDVLSGDADELFVRRLSDYVTGREPQGASVLLTLDPRAQAAAYEGLQGNRGAVVALDPRTGAVLAMVSLPSFEPARLSSFEPADIREYYASLNDATDDPLLNRAISKTYPPGSTFKVVTAAAALESGQVTPETEIPSPVLLDLPQTDSDLRNFGGSACSGETSTLAEALRISCNTAFGALGLQLGDEVLREQAGAFGFGENDLRVPTSVADSRFPDDPNAPQTAQSAIGQFDVRVTPLQMAMVAAGVANGGEVMEPYLVREVQSPDLSVLRTAGNDVLSRAVSDDVAAELTQMMELVVAEGSGRRAQIDGVRVAGKTGTAQHAPGRPPHAWFIGFAPADDPQVAVAVVVEDGGNLGSEATGGALSAQIAAAVMRAALGR
ncbi:penicillin-binding transpeptidase domain-containing protein [soil metagenome]